MQITKIRVENYMCFRDSSEITISQGLNVIVGKNNAGKTAILEALRLAGPSKPFRNRITNPDRSSRTLNPTSVIHIGFKMTKREMLFELSRLEPAPYTLWVNHGSNYQNDYRNFLNSSIDSVHEFGATFNDFKPKSAYYENFRTFANTGNWSLFSVDPNL